MTDHDPREFRGQAIADCNRRVSIWGHTYSRERVYGKAYGKFALYAENLPESLLRRRVVPGLSRWCVQRSKELATLG